MPVFTFVVFFIWKIIDFFVSSNANRFLPYSGFFAYPKDIRLFHLPSWLYSFANFDGAYYLRIAKMGYHQYEQVFFPLYPLLIKFLAPLFSNNQLITGLFISNISFLLGLLFLQKIFTGVENQGLPQAHSRHSDRALAGKDLRRVPWNWALVFILTFPTSFFFGSLYTESLFFLFIVLFFYFLKKEKPCIAGIFGFFASLTRLNGILLLIPFLVLLIQEKNIFRKIKIVFAGVFPLAGLGTYAFYLWKTTGDALYFFHSQAMTGLNRSTHLILLPQVLFRYLKILVTAQHNIQYYVSLFECVTFLFVFTVLCIQLVSFVRVKKPNTFHISLNLFSLANILLPTLTGTFLSIPRFVLLSLSFFLALAQIKNNWIKITIALCFTLIHIVVLSFFIQGYFVS